MLVEKYRPREFKDVVGLDPSIVKFVESTPPHFLFIGSAGTGKTTTAQIIINKLKCESLELNASDERGINTIREKVKSFAMTQSMNGNFKIIFLDEADSLTHDAQTSLRRLMEKYISNVRFILTGNYENKFIEAIQSRCTKYYFKKPKKEEILNRLIYICKEENMNNINNEILNELIDKYYPDIRTMINILGRLRSLDVEYLSVKDIGNMSLNMELLFNHIKEKKFKEARQILLDSNSELEIALNDLHDYILNKKDISFSCMLDAIELIAISLRYLNKVINKNIEVEWLVINLMKIKW